MNNNQPLLKAADIANRLSISKPAAYKLMQSKTIPVIRISAGCVRVDPSDLETYIQKQREAE